MCLEVICLIRLLLPVDSLAMSCDFECWAGYAILQAVHEPRFDKNTSSKGARPTSFTGLQTLGVLGVGIDQNISSGDIRENSGEDACMVYFEVRAVRLQANKHMKDPQHGFEGIRGEGSVFRWRFHWNTVPAFFFP